MEFQLFSSQHFKEYCSWFEDEALKKWLGPKPDDDWLEYVLKDPTGRQYSVFDGKRMLAVIGIVLPTEIHPYCVITDIAVRPKLRGKGTGKIAIHHLLRLHSASIFKTFVDEKNIHAIAFFEHLNWQKAETIDEDGMWAFTYGASKL